MMKISLPFIRIFFLLICILLITGNVIALGGASFGSFTIGVIGGLAFGGLLIAGESFFKELNLRTFNLLMIGLLLGYFMSEVLMLLLNNILISPYFDTNTETRLFLNTFVLLFCAYFATAATIRTSDDLSLSIPFVKFTATTDKKKDLLLDLSALADSRIVDVAASGLLDNHLIIPRYFVKELNHTNEYGDESIKPRARKSLETLKRLEAIPHLNLQYTDANPEEIKDPLPKLLQLGKLLNANLITADLNRVQQALSEGVRIINLHTLSNALKPMCQSGELLTIKIQRHGKEPLQGVGYLEDGTMVVVNGGAKYIEKTIKAQVLSVKHTISGRMIFCNTTDELIPHDLLHQPEDSSHADADLAARAYFNGG